MVAQTVYTEMRGSVGIDNLKKTTKGSRETTGRRVHIKHKIFFKNPIIP